MNHLSTFASRFVLLPVTTLNGTAPGPCGGPARGSRRWCRRRSSPSRFGRMPLNVLVQLSKSGRTGVEAQVATDASAWGDSAIGLTPLARSGAEVVGASGFEAGPLGGGTSIGTGNLLAFKPLWPASRRVLPCLLAPVDGQVEQPVAVIHRLDAASRRPVSLEDLGAVSQVANDVHHADSASNQEGLERVRGSRIPGHLPAHKVAVPGALFVRALAERGVGDVARMNEGQLADLRCIERAPLALLRRRVACVPHEVVGDQHPASLKRVQ